MWGRSADVLEECHALQRRLSDSADKDKDLRLEKVDLQEALIKSEEERLEIAKALIDFQVEHNQSVAEAERTKFDLEKRVLELETQVRRGIPAGFAERSNLCLTFLFSRFSSAISPPLKKNRLSRRR